MGRATESLAWASFGAGAVCLAVGALVWRHERGQLAFLSAVEGRPVAREELRRKGVAVCVPRAMALRYASEVR